MHRYSSPSDPQRRLPKIQDFRFDDALDVIEYASIEGMFDWRTWSEVWHLDATGRFRCYGKLSSFTTVRDLVDDPFELLEMRRQGLVQGGCPDHWLINEPRQLRYGGEAPDEPDVAAFLALRTMLADVGVDLVDCMLWADDLRCWSLHELTSGTTRWALPRAA